MKRARGVRAWATCTLALLLVASVGPTLRPAHGREAREEDHVWRVGVERAWAHGQLDVLDLASPADAAPRIAFVRWLRDTWWRRGPLPEALQQARSTDALLRARLTWLRDGGRTRFPAPGVTSDIEPTEPWRVLSALIQDRQLRESPQRPVIWFEQSPLYGQLHADPWTGEALDATYEQLSIYDDAQLEGDDEASHAAARSIRRGAWLRAALALVGLLALTLLIARTAGRNAT